MYSFGMERMLIELGDIVRTADDPTEFEVVQTRGTVGVVSDDDLFLLQLGTDGGNIRWKPRKELSLDRKK
jgi:hypothetical protein